MLLLNKTSFTNSQSLHCHLHLRLYSVAMVATVTTTTTTIITMSSINLSHIFHHHPTRPSCPSWTRDILYNYDKQISIFIIRWIPTLQKKNPSLLYQDHLPLFCKTRQPTKTSQLLQTLLLPYRIIRKCKYCHRRRRRRKKKKFKGIAAPALYISPLAQTLF